MDAFISPVTDAVHTVQGLGKDGVQFMTRCTKPDKKEYLEICRAVALGFAIMGGIGYFVKLVHIPINNILVGGA